MKKILWFTLILFVAAPISAQPLIKSLNARIAKEKAAKRASEAAPRATSATGKVCKDANGCPVLEYRGDKYSLIDATPIPRNTYNIYANEELGREIAVQEVVAPKGKDPVQYATERFPNEGAMFRDSLNPKDVVTGSLHMGNDNPHYTVKRFTEVNDSTARVSTIEQTLNSKVTQAQAQQAMMKDGKQIRELNPQLIKGDYKNYPPMK